MKRRKQTPTLPDMRLQVGDLIDLAERDILIDHTQHIIGILLVASYGPDDPERYGKVVCVSTHPEMIPIYEEYMMEFSWACKDKDTCGPSKSHEAVGMAMQSPGDPDHFLYLAGLPDEHTLIGGCCDHAQRITAELLRALNMAHALMEMRK